MVGKEGFEAGSEARKVFEFADPRSPAYTDLNSNEVFEFKLINIAAMDSVARYRFDIGMSSKTPLRFDPILLRYNSDCCLKFALLDIGEGRWSMTVSNECGGLAYCFSSATSLLAPDSGYRSDLLVGDGIDFDNNRFYTRSKVFFKIDRTQLLYGTMEIYFHANTQPENQSDISGAIAISVAVNKNGGRDLIFDLANEGSYLHEGDVKNGLRKPIVGH